MKKMIFVDGSQGVGKSTLIKGVSCKTPLYVYKFPFSDYSTIFNLKEGPALKGFQLGKDLATLYFLGRSGLQNHWSSLIDRGPMSTVYYSLTTGRMSAPEVEDFFKILSETSEFFSYVFIIDKNSPGVIRKKLDGFDRLRSEEVAPGSALRLMVSLSRKYRINLKIFENDFSQSISDNVNRFYQLLKEEL